MTQAIHFKILQRQNKFKNPKHLVQIPDFFSYSRDEYQSAENYLLSLERKKIAFTYPGHVDYPRAFYFMKNPPLFLEYQGAPLWKQVNFLSVVGSRKMSDLTKEWMSIELSQFLKLCTEDNKSLKKKTVGIVSGGAYGVDQWSHLIALKHCCPTIVVLPCGLEKIYPSDLRKKFELFHQKDFCFLSEFECNQTIQKSFFFHRNRLIAALGEMLLVVQAQIASGTMLTVHHALENGKPVMTLPCHPQINGFSGNLKLLNEGAAVITSGQTLSDFWQAELYGFCSESHLMPTNSLDQGL